MSNSVLALFRVYLQSTSPTSSSHRIDLPVIRFPPQTYCASISRLLFFATFVTRVTICLEGQETFQLTSMLFEFPKLKVKAVARNCPCVQNADRHEQSLYDTTEHECPIHSLRIGSVISHTLRLLSHWASLDKRGPSFAATTAAHNMFQQPLLTGVLPTINHGFTA